MIRMLKLYDKLNSFEYNAPYFFRLGFRAVWLQSKMENPRYIIINVGNKGVLMTKNIYLLIYKSVLF